MTSHISMQGLVSYVDFKKVFKKSDDDLESHIAEGSSSNFEQVLPKMIPELADGNKVIDLNCFVNIQLCLTNCITFLELMIFSLTFITVESRGGHCSLRSYPAVVQSEGMYAHCHLPHLLLLHISLVIRSQRHNVK